MPRISSTRSSIRVRPLIYFTPTGDNDFDLAFDPFPEGYALFDSTTGRWIHHENLDRWLTGRVFSNDGGHTWYGYYQGAGARRSPTFRASSAGTAMLRIENWVVRRFKLRRFHASRATIFHWDRELGRSNRRWDTHSGLPEGVVPTVDGQPMGEWSQTITVNDDRWDLETRIGRLNTTSQGFASYQDARQYADDLFDSVVRLRYPEHVRLPSTSDLPRVGSHNFAQFIEQPSLAGWAEGWS